MYDKNTHPLLAQVPLTVSPFISLPTATTLPYTYKALPSTIPPSLTPDESARPESSKPAFVISSSGQQFHPDEILQSSQNLQQYIESEREKAERVLAEWQTDIKDRELAEKRRVAPGWLDRDEKILQPEKSASASTGTEKALNLMHQDAGLTESGRAKDVYQTNSTAEGEELDRAFGKTHVT